MMDFKEINNSIKGHNSETFHGKTVTDYYRKLENLKDTDTLKWIEHQTAYTDSYMNNNPLKTNIQKILESNAKYKELSIVYKNENFFYYYKNENLQQQPILYRSNKLDENIEEIILDPTFYKKDGTAAINVLSFSPDGRNLVYGISYNGSDWQEIRIKSLDDSESFSEVLTWIKFTSIAWSEDNRGFYYSRYPILEKPLLDVPINSMIYHHKLGTSQEQDELIFQDPSQKFLTFSPIISTDKKYLLIKSNFGTEPKTRYFYLDIKYSRKFKPLINDGEYNYTFIGNQDNLFYFITDFQAPKGRIIAIDILNTHKNHWQEVVPETNDTIVEAKLACGKFILKYIHQAYHILKIFNINNKTSNILPLPKYISIFNIYSTKSTLYFNIHSYLTPSSRVEYNYEKQQISIVKNELKSFDHNSYITEQVYYTSKDGTEISMFITHKKDIELTGNHPLLLFGYGGYNLAQTPIFNSSILLWLQSGGIYAVANIRGGNENGENWHMDGILDKKQNVFDDFIYAAKWLIDNHYTNNEKIAIMGRSNGGLLVSACIIQQPNLFKAGISMVPVSDMLRFQLYTAGLPWTTEFGDATVNPNHFDFMMKYSPIHNVHLNTNYPAVLITTGDTDDRVVPFHAYKLTAAMQEAQNSKNPILLRIDKNAGHGHGKPLYKILNEYADIFTFLFKELHITK